MKHCTQEDQAICPSPGSLADQTRDVNCLKKIGKGFIENEWKAVSNS